MTELRRERFGPHGIGYDARTDRVHGDTVLGEFDYVGVIIGPDLKYRDGRLVADHEGRASTDRSIFVIKKMFREDPTRAQEKVDEIVKNTYRTLMSRGIKGCYVYCVSEQLQEYMKERIDRISRGD